jgi:hypothetical protein
LPEPEYVPPDSAEDLTEPEEAAVDLAEEEPENDVSAEEEEALAAAVGESEEAADIPPPVPEAETVVENPPEPVQPPAPPASLRPPEKAAAAPPPKKPAPVPPAPLAALPVRVLSNETEVHDAPDRTQDPLPVARSLRVNLGEPTEISFPGTGWVYTGEVNGKKGLAYQRRGITEGNQVFTFRPEAVGSYRLKFLKQNLVRKTDTEEIIDVAVVDAALLNPTGGVAGETSETLQAAGEPLTPEKTAVESVMLFPDTFNERSAPVVDDTSLWNRGQELEAPGPSSDIKGALTAYKTLIRDYPQSEHYNGSQKRIAYLERFLSISASRLPETNRGRPVACAAGRPRRFFLNGLYGMFFTKRTKKPPSIACKRRGPSFFN